MYSIIFQFLILVSTVVSKSALTEMVNYSPERKQNILVASQRSSLGCFVSDAHTIIRSVTAYSDVECLTTSSSVVSSNSEQDVSTITTTTGWKCAVCTYV